MQAGIQPPINTLSFPRSCKEGVSTKECEKRCVCVPTLQGFDEIKGSSVEDDEWCRENCYCGKAIHY